MNKKESPKIDWEEVKTKRKKEEKKEEKKAEISEERLAEIMAQVESNEPAKEQKVEQPKNNDEKDEVKLELNKKFEKGKLRPANFITFLFLTLAGAVLIAQLAFVLFYVGKGFIKSADGIEKIFGKDSGVLSVLAAFGYLIYFLILITGVAFAGGGVYVAVMSIIDSWKLNFLKNEDYMLNLRIKRICFLELPPSIALDLFLIFILPFFGDKLFAFVMYSNIPLAVIHLACLISTFVQSIVARVKFKKSTTEENYKLVLSEKQRINRLYMRRRRSEGTGRLY